jgi:hypothetical protein
MFHPNFVNNNSLKNRQFLEASKKEKDSKIHSSSRVVVGANERRYNVDICN